MQVPRGRQEMGFTVKAMVLAGIRKTAIVGRPAASLQKPEEVSLDTIHAGIRGSDTHYYTNGRIRNQGWHPPIPHAVRAGPS